MANPTLTTAAFSVERGGKFVFTATQLAGADSDSDFAYSILSTPPTHGHLELDGVLVTGATQITNAKVVAGSLIYYHDGTNNSDSIGFTGHDAAAHTSAEGTEAITKVANGGWLVLCKPYGAPAVVPALVSTQVEGLIIKAEWDATHSGASEVVELVSTTAVTVITKDDLTFIPDAVDSPFAFKNAQVVLDIQNRLGPILEDSANADIEALVNTYGGLMAVPGAVVMDGSVQRRWRDISVAVNSAHIRFRQVQIDDFAGALEELKGTLD